MQALPPELLLHLLTHLDPASRWPFARVCKQYYNLSRPSLFSAIQLNLTISDGRVDDEQMVLHRQVLSGPHRVGPLVTFLSLSFEVESLPGGQPTFDKQSGIMRATGLLLGMTPNLVVLSLCALKGEPPAQTATARAAEIAVLEICLSQLQHLNTFILEARAQTRLSWWLDIILPAIPANVTRLSFETNYCKGARSIQNVINSFDVSYRTCVKDLRFECPFLGRSGDALLSLLLRSSPSLEEVLISDGTLSEARVAALFAH